MRWLAIESPIVEPARRSNAGHADALKQMSTA
jgi:hypothetical protein